MYTGSRKDKEGGERRKIGRGYTKEGRDSEGGREGKEGRRGKDGGRKEGGSF